MWQELNRWKQINFQCNVNRAIIASPLTPNFHILRLFCHCLSLSTTFKVIWPVSQGVTLSISPSSLGARRTVFEVGASLGGVTFRAKQTKGQTMIMCWHTYDRKCRHDLSSSSLLAWICQVWPKASIKDAPNFLTLQWVTILSVWVWLNI